MGFMPQPILQTCWAKAAAYSPLQKSPPYIYSECLSEQKNTYQYRTMRQYSFITVPQNRYRHENSISSFGSGTLFKCL